MKAFPDGHYYSPIISADDIRRSQKVKMMKFTKKLFPV